MKNASWNTVSHHPFRGRLTMKNGLPLLILTALTAALFAPPTATFASSNLRDGSGLFPTIGVITTLSKRSSVPTVPLTTIHMLDEIHGWALTDTSVLKTSDGGQHWNVVTPPNFNIAIPSSAYPALEGTFMSQNVAWVVGVTQQGMVIIQHTSDGGSHWQRSQFFDGFVDFDPIAVGGITIDPPHFLKQEGWLDIEYDKLGEGSSAHPMCDFMSAGMTSEIVLFHTTSFPLRQASQSRDISWTGSTSGQNLATGVCTKVKMAERVGIRWDQ